MPDNGVEEEPEMIQQVAEQTAERRHVKVWFGQHVIGEYVADPDAAARYAAAMDRKFAGLKITTDVVLPGETPVRALPLPPDRLWGTTPN
jgi:hypothetical protein